MLKNRVIFRLLPVALAVLIFSPRLLAQFDNGSLVGTVHDSSGALVPGVTVTVTNTQTGVESSRTTSDGGDWEVPSLRTGAYTVRAAKQGFADAVATNLMVSVGSRARVDLVLQVGQTQETVEVKDVQLQLETDSSERGQIVSQYQTEAFPLVSRTYSQLVLLTSGTRQSGVGTGSASLVREGSFNVEGQRSTFNNYLLDGLDNNAYGTSNQGFSNQIIQPSPDSITQFQVVTNNESAEYGRSSGATINTAFASGTNQLHFKLYEFVRNTSLNAIGYFYNPLIGKQQFHRNQFGGNVGGPILKDKLFFFADYEGFRQSRSLGAISSIPTQAEARNFTFPAALVDPYNNKCAIPAGTPIGAVPCAAGDLSAVATKIAALFPAPNLGAPGATSSNYEVNQRFTDTLDKYDARFDYQISAKASTFLRVSQLKETAIDYPTLPGVLDGGTNGRQRIMDQQVALGYTRQVGVNQLLEARLGASYTKGGKYTLSLGQPNAGSAFGIPGLPDDNARVNGGLPTFALTGFTSFGRQATNPQWQYPFELNPKINYSWVRGRHSLKFGYEYQRVHIVDQDVNPIYGRFTFQGGKGYSGNPFADFLFGASTKYELTNFFIAHMRQVLHFGYVQDDWKVLDNLTLNLGVRYEYGSPYWDKDGALTNFDPGTSPTTLQMLHAKKSGSTYERSLVHPDLNDFAPRLGFAWAPSHRTSIRGGFGVSYIHFNRAGSGNELPLNAPQVLFVVKGQSSPAAPGYRRLDQGFQPGLTAPDPTFPGGFNPVADNITYIPKNYSDSYVESYFLSVQRELAKNVILDVAYVGNRGLKLLEFANFNQGNPNVIDSSNPAAPVYLRPYKTFGDITAALNSSYSNYNSLQVRYEQRFVAGLTLLNSFTWSRAFDNAAGSLENSNGNFPAPQDINNLRADYGPSNYDQPLTNVTSFVYDLPFGRGRAYLNRGGFVNEALGGWQVSAINTMNSGQPLTVVYAPPGPVQNQVSGITADFRGANNFRPNRLPGVPILAHGKVPATASAIQYLDNTALAGTPAGTTTKGAFQTPVGLASGGIYPSPFGNASRNLAYSDPYFNLDLALNKKFLLTERANIEFRSEAFNVLNKTNFSAPNTTLTSGAFGQVSSTFPARILQFALKLSY